MVKFYSGDCGFPVDTDGTPGDLLAEQLRRTALDFAQDLKRALQTGSLGYHSSCMLSGMTSDHLNVVADQPTPQNIVRAVDSFVRDITALTTEDH
ncbi:hypothetical protein FR943_13725 [Mycobacterium sp. TNTM28]|uniref:DUF732 domain-containing protein n=1 Tax=[Mycobacterium] fortunisiensis TaxID=2600579 RepID=A0ABS6KMU9_9MYCO|nr:hypothetical protein [[Mycobacterium] fortunisiensis]MBU9764896.1 hypothetical protein [[Mycobacterium] fortunisiensis]